jgi:hypothetical protein
MERFNFHSVSANGDSKVGNLVSEKKAKLLPRKQEAYKAGGKKSMQILSDRS